jgi:hypothetical protein
MKLFFAGFEGVFMVLFYRKPPMLWVEVMGVTFVARD